MSRGLDRVSLEATIAGEEDREAGGVLGEKKELTPGRRGEEIPVLMTPDRSQLHAGRPQIDTDAEPHFQEPFSGISGGC